MRYSLPQRDEYGLLTEAPAAGLALDVAGISEDGDHVHKVRRSALRAVVRG